jgi:hypothetical protein
MSGKIKDYSWIVVDMNNKKQFEKDIDSWIEHGWEPHGIPFKYTWEAFTGEYDADDNRIYETHEEWRQMIINRE